MSNRFVANFIRFPGVQKFWKSVKIWQSYRDFKGENFFWDTVYKHIGIGIAILFKKYCWLPGPTLILSLSWHVCRLHPCGCIEPHFDGSPVCHGVLSVPVAGW